MGDIYVPPSNDLTYSSSLLNSADIAASTNSFTVAAPEELNHPDQSHTLADILSINSNKSNPSQPNCDDNQHLPYSLMTHLQGDSPNQIDFFHTNMLREPDIPSQVPLFESNNEVQPIIYSNSPQSVNKGIGCAFKFFIFVVAFVILITSVGLIGMLILMFIGMLSHVY
ncbi:hypothetical protein QTN25_006158 [Entamoeba marina]